MMNRTFRQSLRAALAGIRYAWETEKNLRIHFVALVTVVVVSLLLKTTFVETALLYLASGMVIVAELFNTAVEKIVDLKLSREYNPLARIAKDVAAGAVLAAALTALLTGGLVLMQVLVRRGFL